MKQKREITTSPITWLGFSVVHSLRAVLGLGGRILLGFLRMVWYMLRQAGSFFALVGRTIAGSFREHNRSAQEEAGRIRSARKEGRGAVFLRILRFVGMYIFGEHGILRTGFNYILPVLSIGFFAAVLRYGLGLEYAISVVCNGQELGMISSESEFERAEEEVQKRVSAGNMDMDLEFHPAYTLKIVSDSDQYVDARTIADRLLENSVDALTKAYGVYVDGEFIGAVVDPEEISNKMDSLLAEYAFTLDDLVNEIYYTKEITYEEGLYLSESVSSSKDVLDILTDVQWEDGRYVVQKLDTFDLVAAKYHMSPEELQELNPSVKGNPRPGTTLRVRIPNRYIPIAYTRTLTVTSYIDYSTMEVETAALNLGKRRLLSKGVMGEKTAEVLVTYINGVEEMREQLSSVVTKEPVPEQIGIGTYTPQPASTSTVIEGNGMFGWPINGGSISDYFISDRNHKGLDIAAPFGTEIYAAEAGTVTRAGWNTGGYGNFVIIDHGDGYSTLYGHCSSVVCYAGQQVEKGQLIAYVGSTGNSTGNHCHFEVMINNICTDPCNYLRVNAD